MKLPLLGVGKALKTTLSVTVTVGFLTPLRVALECPERCWINYVMICRYFEVVVEVVVSYRWGKLRCGEFVDQ